MENIRRFNEDTFIDGLEIKAGFVSWTVNGVLFIDSGCNCYNLHQIYTKSKDGQWVYEWQTIDPRVSVAVRKQFETEKNENYQKAIVIAENLIKEGVELHISNCEIKFTEVAPGKNSNKRGGEHGYYQVYQPTETEGVYAVYAETTYDFGVGYRGFMGFDTLSLADYTLLKNDSDIVEMFGYRHLG